MIRILLNTILFLFLSSAAWAAASPVIFYSDLTAGPNTGGQNNDGVFVTIWGNNFGSTQGSSTVKVGGGVVANYQTWTNTMICFQLGPNAATGNIVVTTSGGSSNGLAFNVQAGNIYFVQPGAATNGTGTYASPFNHLYYFENIANPGDTVYVMAGTIYDEIDGHTGWYGIIVPERGGTQGKPVSWIAYPNATVILQADGGTSTWSPPGSGSQSVQWIFEGYTSWHTVSKFTMQLTGTGGTQAVVGSTNYDGWKIVGNNITGVEYPYDLIDIAGNYSEVLGNEIHDSGSSSFNNEDHSIYWDGGGTNVVIAWNYLHGNKNVGYEISCFHQGNSSEPTRVGSIHDNLIVNPNSYIIKGILLGDVDSGEDETDVEGQNIEVYNNVLYNLGYNEYGGAITAVSGTAYIYNNTIYQSPESKGTIQFQAGGIGPGGGHPVWYVANNIIYNSISGSLYLSDGNGNAPTWANFALLTNNNYYGAGDGPSQDPSPVNANPQFVTPGTNFQLQITSPDINAGYNTTSIVAKDFSGLVRSSAPSVGAYEYTGSISPSTPVVAITSPSTGTNVTAGTNVSITASATEGNGTITNISIYNGSTLLGSSSSSPYTYVMTDPPAGNYTLTAVATDANGVSTTSSPVTVTVATQSIIPSSPVVNISSPGSGSAYTAGSNVTITTSASETNGTIKNISLYNGSGILLGSSSSSPYNYVYTDILAGGYSFYAVATDANGVSTTSSPVTITVAAPGSPLPAEITIISPSNGNSYLTGSTVPVTVTASETNGSIRYIYLYTGSGVFLGSSAVFASSGSYTYSNANMALGSYSFYAIATDVNGIAYTSSTVSFTVTSTVVSPSITTQPASVTVTAPATATFSVAATGTPTLTYQWQQEASGSSSYSAISGATSSFYTTAATTTANSGSKYKCVVTNSSGSVTSSAATLTVNAASAMPSITTQPASVTVTAPAAATFSVAATGTPAPTYQWQQEASGSSTYTAISGATSTSYTTAATTTANSGTKFECVITNAAGSVTSNAATLTVSGTPVVSITSPSTGSSVTSGSNVSITATASETNGTITNVAFYNGSTLLGTDSTSPYTYVMSDPSAGSYTLTAIATDANGVSSTSSPVTITVTASAAPSPAVVTITSPTNGSSYIAGSNVPVTVNASEANGSIRYIYLYTGSGVFLGSSPVFASTGSYTYTNSNMTPGTYSFYSIATDVNGVPTQSSTLTITVIASYPVVSITSPTNKSYIKAGSNLTITAAASETNGTIATVFFYNGSTLIGSSSSSPYSITLTSVSAGTYTFTAMATDVLDNSTTSSPVTVKAH